MNFKNLDCSWIWRDMSDEPNQYVSFKQMISLNDNNARLYISCDTNYVARLNGKVVGFGQYLAYPENKYYDILELANAAIVGENTLTIDIYYQGVSTSCYAKGQPGLIYAVSCGDEFIPNHNVMCRKTPGFKEGTTPMITRQLGPTFLYDASEISQFWSEVTILDFSAELPVSLRKRPVKKLVTDEYTPFNICGNGIFTINTQSDEPAERIYSALCAPKSLNEITKDNRTVIDRDNTYVIIDLGGETAGYFNMDMQAPEGVRIDVGFGEHLIDGRVRTVIDSRKFAFTYYTKSGENKYTNYFRRIGGKYLQLHFTNVREPIVVNYVGLMKAIYPVKLAPMPNLTDTLDKKIYETGVNTLLCCMHEHYEDTPWREQSLYAMDSRNQTLFGYSAFEDNSTFIKASIELLGSSLRDDGFIDLTSPSSGRSAIPCFTAAWLIWLCEYIDRTNDKSFLIVHENKIRKIIDGIEKRTENNIILLPVGERIWNFYDWASGIDTVKDVKTDVLINLYFCYAAKKLMSIEKHMRDRELILRIRKLYKNLKKAINKEFYNSDEGIYYTFPDNKDHVCKLAQALSVCCGASPNKRKSRKILTENTNMVDFTLYTKEFEYEALAQNIKKYGNYILSDIRKIWGNMIYEGADTFYETTKGAADFDNAGSLCHGWSAAPVYWYRILFG